MESKAIHHNPRVVGGEGGEASLVGGKQGKTSLKGANEFLIKDRTLRKVSNEEITVHVCHEKRRGMTKNSAILMTRCHPRGEQSSAILHELEMLRVLMEDLPVNAKDRVGGEMITIIEDGTNTARYMLTRRTPIVFVPSRGMPVRGATGRPTVTIRVDRSIGPNWLVRSEVGMTTIRGTNSKGGTSFGPSINTRARKN